MPRISVIMGVYNGELYLKSAIDSILKQTFEDFELIICDDGSSDQSIEIIKKYMLQDKRIKLIINTENLGLAASLNKCLWEAQGEFIARMDSDDISVPNRFQKQISYLDHHKEISILGGGAKLFDENGVYGSKNNIVEYNNINVFKNNYFIHPTVIIRKDALLDVKGYTVAEFTYRTEDYDLWCKLCEKGYQGRNLNDYLLYYRQDKKSYSKRKFKYRIDAYKLKKIWYKKLNVPFRYKFLVYKPILVGVLPKWIMRIYHRVNQ